MDWILERTNHKGFLEATLGDDVFTDLEFADDFAMLAERLDVRCLALETMNEEARPFGLEMNWSKTKIQTTADTPPLMQNITVPGKMWWRF